MIFDAEIRDVDDLDVEELKAEVLYWREDAIASLGPLIGRIEEALVCEGLPMAAEYAAILRRRLGAIEGALTGDGLDRCWLCSDVILPGQPMLREVNEGDVHAGCLGQHIEGDRYQLDADSVVGPDDEPIEGGDGVLVSHPHRPPFEAAKIVERLGLAERLCDAPAIVEARLAQLVRSC